MQLEVIINRDKIMNVLYLKSVALDVAVKHKPQPIDHACRQMLVLMFIFVIIKRENKAILACHRKGSWFPTLKSQRRADVLHFYHPDNILFIFV